MTSPSEASPAPPAARAVNTLSIVALVLAFVVPLGAIICGHLALGQIKRTGEGGHGLALAGTIIGWILSGLILLALIIVVGYTALAASEGYFTSPP